MQSFEDVFRKFINPNDTNLMTDNEKAEYYINLSQSFDFKKVKKEN